MARKAAISEKLTELNIERVIALLSQEKPITKKAACEILGINYNTTRLDSILEDYKKRKDFEKEQREKKRYKPATDAEIQFVVEGYLSGEPVSELAKRIYRSDSFINSILDRIGVPRRSSAFSYFRPQPLPEECISNKFEVGEKVYSSRYESLATIIKEFEQNGDKVYRVYLTDERWQQYAYQPWWELGSLKHLQKYGVFK